MQEILYMQPETIEELMDLFTKGEQIYVDGNTTPSNLYHYYQKNKKIQGHGIITRIKKMSEGDFTLTEAKREEYDWDEFELNYWRKLSAQGLTYAVCLSYSLTSLIETSSPDGYEEVHSWKETDWILLGLKE